MKGRLCLEGTKYRTDMSRPDTLWAGGRAIYVLSPFWLKSVSHNSQFCLQRWSGTAAFSHIGVLGRANPPELLVAWRRTCWARQILTMEGTVIGVSRFSTDPSAQQAPLACHTCRRPVETFPQAGA